MAESEKHYLSAEEKRRQVNRMARVIGHLQYVKRMIEEDADCSDVLIQIAAAESALKGVGKEMINEHITYCFSHAVEAGDTEAIEDFKNAIKRFF